MAQTEAAKLRFVNFVTSRNPSTTRCTECSYDSPPEVDASTTDIDDCYYRDGASVIDAATAQGSVKLGYSQMCGREYLVSLGPIC